MTFKFSPPAAATANRLCALFLLGSACALSAQTPDPTPTPKVKVKAGSVRFWNLLPRNGGSLELVAGAGPDGRVLQNAAPLNFFYSAYVTLPPARYVLRVFHAGERQNPLKSFDVLLRDNAYFTVIARAQPDGQLAVEMVDDYPEASRPPSADPAQPPPPPANRVTVRQLCRDARVTITAAGQHSTEALNYGDVQTLTGLPEGIVPLAMRAIMTPGGAKSWSTEADCRAARRSTLLVIADPYGRLRPRIIPDGPSRAVEAEILAANSPKP